MADATQDPFEDEFDNATSEYITTDELDGRLVLIWSTGIRTGLQGASGLYDATEAKYVILDGETTEKIDVVPKLVDDGLFSAGAIHSKLKNRVNGRPVLGRVDSRPSQRNKNVKAYGLADPTDADKAIARAWLKAHPQNAFE
jgi:hypothetical protein